MCTRQHVNRGTCNDQQVKNKEMMGAEVQDVRDDGKPAWKIGSGPQKWMMQRCSWGRFKRSDTQSCEE